MDVDFAIKTFLRPHCLRRLVASILRYYPHAQLSIADDGDPDSAVCAYYDELQGAGHRVLRLPFNAGISAGRNALVDATARPYVLILDDDFVFTEQTRVETLVEVLAADPAIGVAAGTLLDGGIEPRAYEYRLRLEDGLLHYDPVVDPARCIAGHLCRDADVVLNFALFRRRVFDDVRWDASLKTVEHTDFFLRLARTPWRVVHVRGVVAAHHPATSPRYARYRDDPHSGALLRRKWGIDAAVYHDTPGTEDDQRRLRLAHLEAARNALWQGRALAACRWLWRASARTRGEAARGPV